MKHVLMLLTVHKTCITVITTSKPNEEVKTMNVKPMNPALSLVNAIVETYDLEKVSELLCSGDWIAIGAAKSGDGSFLFALGRVND